METMKVREKIKSARINMATVAVAHSMLIAISYVLNGHEFYDLGSLYYSQFDRERKINSHLRQLKSQAKYYDHENYIRHK